MSPVWIVESHPGYFTTREGAEPIARLRGERVLEWDTERGGLWHDGKLVAWQDPTSIQRVLKAQRIAQHKPEEKPVSPIYQHPRYAQNPFSAVSPLPTPKPVARVDLETGTAEIEGSRFYISTGVLEALRRTYQWDKDPRGRRYAAVETVPSSATPWGYELVIPHQPPQRIVESPQIAAMKQTAAMNPISPDQARAAFGLPPLTKEPNMNPTIVQPGQNPEADTTTELEYGLQRPDGTIEWGKVGKGNGAVEVKDLIPTYAFEARRKLAGILHGRNRSAGRHHADGAGYKIVARLVITTTLQPTLVATDLGLKGHLQTLDTTTKLAAK